MINKAVFSLLIFVSLLFLMTPFQNYNVLANSIDTISVDLAFLLALPSLFQSGAQYGPDVVFTYGPWGMLAYGLVPPELYTLVMLLRGVLAGVVALIVISIYCMSQEETKAQLAVGLGFLGLVFLWINSIDQGYWFFPSLYLALYYAVIDTNDTNHSRSITFIALAAAAAAGLAGMIKFNTFVLGAGIQVIILMRDISLKRIPLIFLVWCLSTALAWLAAGQDLANMPTWIMSSLDLSAGYSEAMSKGFYQPYGIFTIIAFASVLLGFIAIAITSVWNAKSWHTIATVLGSTVMLSGIAWKHFIGGNQLEQATSEILSGIWLLVAAHFHHSQGRSFQTRQTAIGVGFVIVLCAFLAQPWLILNAPNLQSTLKQKFVAIDRFFEGLPADGGWESLEKSILDSIPVQTDLTGRADIYPQHTGVIIANRQLQYAPRPAYLSLNAHTTALANANAHYLRNTPPDVVLFQILHESRAVNKRHPATRDGPSWPELITRYDIHSDTRDFLVLKRRASPLQVKFRPMATKRVKLGETINVDLEGKLVWARVRLKPSFVGRVSKLFYKLPHVTLHQTHANGTQTVSQIVPALGQAGFLLSPFVSETADFARLMQNSIVDPIDSNKVVTSFTLKSEPRTALLWSQFIEIDLSEVVFSNDGYRTVPPRTAENMLLGELRKNVKTCLTAPSPAFIPDVPNGQAHIFHAPCATSIEVPRTAQGVTIKLGLRTGDVPLTSDGVGFSLVGVDNDGNVVKEVTRYLNPKLEKDRGEQSIALEWPAETVSQLRIEFRTGPASDPQMDHSYISGIEFK